MGKLGRIFGSLGNERGHRSESLALLALRAGPVPDWLRSVEKAPWDLDRRGVDLIVASDVGKLYLQIKSSMAGARRFEAKPRRLPIAVVVEDPRDEDPVIRDRLIGAAAELRRRFLLKRG